MISVLVPIYNEQGNILVLVEAIHSVMQRNGYSYEIVMVDDGSRDKSFEEMTEAAGLYPNIHALRLRRNSGQTAAIMAAIDEAKGDILIPIDADLQNDPEDIPRLIDKLNTGYDLVSGWRHDRQDAKVKRVFVSQVANTLISRISGVHLHDYGCSLKAYRRDVIKDVRLYGEMHRFIPIYAAWQGARWTELEVNHRPRLHGVSKYGLNRIFKVVLDLAFIVFMERYFTKPGYVFGGFGVVCFGSALASGLFAVILKLFAATSFISTPLPLLTVTFFLTGVMSVLMGLLAEMQVRTYYESQNRRPYGIKQRVLSPTQASNKETPV